MRCRIRADGSIEFFDISLGLRRLVERCRDDLGLFCKEFLRDSFDYEFSSQHRELLGLLDDGGIARLAVCGWRGFGKTTILSAFVIRNLIYRRSSFVMYVSSNLEQAIMVTEGIKLELCNNDRILDIFGSFRGVYDVSNVKLGFSKRAYYLHCPYSGEAVGYVLPKGVGQSVRGVNVHLGGRRRRPDLVCVDDVEKDEDVYSEEVRVRTRLWFYGALLRVVDTKREPIDNRWGDRSWWRVVVIDTMKHDQCLMAYLKRDKQFKYIDFPRARRVSGEVAGAVKVGDEYWVSNVPEWVDNSSIEAEIKASKDSGVWEVYRREMLCETSDLVEDRVFPEDFRYYSDDNVIKGLDCFILVDPARTITGSSRTAISVIYLDVENGRIYIHDQIVDRFTVEKQVEVYRKLVMRYKPSVFVIETIGADDYLKVMIDNQVLSEFSNVMPLYLRPFKINAKEVRASDLIRLYKAGCVYHHTRLKNGELERGLLSFPNCSSYDALDSAGFIIDTMNKLNIEFGVRREYNRFTSEIEDMDRSYNPYKFNLGLRVAL